jgi:hypothetical protein
MDGDENATGNLARRATWLALAGYAPFAVLSVWLFTIAPDHPWRADTILLLKTYGALILSFLGGIRFGLAVGADRKDRAMDLTLAVLPALAAWVALRLGEPQSFALLAVAFAAHGAWDSFAAHRGYAPDWFGRMRIKLTVLVVMAMVLALLATA